MANVNEQLLKNATRQEVISFVKTPSIWKQIARMSSELRNTGEKHPIYKSLGRCVATREFQTQTMVLEIEPQDAESLHTLVLIQISDFVLQSQDELKIGPVFQVRVVQFLGTPDA